MSLLAFSYFFTSFVSISLFSMIYVYFCLCLFGFRRSRSEVFLVKGVLKICSKFTGEHPCRSVISPFTMNNSGWLLLCFFIVSLFYVGCTFFKVVSSFLRATLYDTWKIYKNNFQIKWQFLQKKLLWKLLGYQIPWAHHKTLMNLVLNFC